MGASSVSHQYLSSISRVSHQYLCFICVFNLCVSSMCFIRVFHQCVSSVCFIRVFYPCAYVSPQALGDVDQQNISFYADTTAWDKTSCCFSKQKASKRQGRRPPTHRDRAGWVHFLQVSTIWAIACRAYLQMTK